MSWSHRYAESEYDRRRAIYLRTYVYPGLKDTPEARDHYARHVAPYKPTATTDATPPTSTSTFSNAVSCSNCGHVDSKEFMKDDGDGNWRCAYGMGCSD